MGVGVLQLHALRREARTIRRPRVAAARVVGGHNLVRFLERHRLVFHVVGAKEVGHVELGRRADVGANTGAFQFLGALDPRILSDHEALAVIEVDAREIQAERGVTNQRPGRVP